MLLTAHHQDDQAETVLLQLKRGAGPKGLSGMAKLHSQQGVLMARPLLEVGREDIVAYAKAQSLSWIEDESNLDSRFDRNFLRQQILPAITQRWPAFAQTVSRSAALCAEQQALLDEVCDEKLTALCSAPGCISVTGLNAMSESWQNALLRRWLAHNQVMMPGAKQLMQVRQMLTAKADAQPLVKAQRH